MILSEINSDFFLHRVYPFRVSLKQGVSYFFFSLLIMYPIYLASLIILFLLLTMLVDFIILMVVLLTSWDSGNWVANSQLLRLEGWLSIILGIFILHGFHFESVICIAKAKLSKKILVFGFTLYSKEYSISQVIEVTKRSSYYNGEEVYDIKLPGKNISAFFIDDALNASSFFSSALQTLTVHLGKSR